MRPRVGRRARRVPRGTSGARAGDGRALARDRRASRRRRLGRGHSRERRVRRFRDRRGRRRMLRAPGANGRCARRARGGRGRGDGARSRGPRRVRRRRARRPLHHGQRVQGESPDGLARSGHRAGRGRIPLGVRGAARMSLTVRLATPLRAAAGGNATITLDAADVASLAKEIGERYPELGARVLRDGAFGRFVNVFVDGEDVRFLGPEGDLSGKSTVEILPAMSGGAVAPLPRQRAEHEVYGSFIDETIGIVARQTRDTVSFAVGSPAREALELVGADDLAATVIRREGASALGYTITEGEPELREVIAGQARARGIDASAADVLVSAGALQAIDLACRVFLRPGDVVVAESPGFANALSAFRNHGARVLEVPVDREGLDVSEAARLIRRANVRPRMFFVVPNFQNPSGETLSLARRHALLALAASHDALVVDDDPYGLLRYRGADLPPLAALDRGVVSIGTFSKTFLPGLRVGWVIATPDVIRRMAKVKQTMDSSTGTLAQRIVLEFHRRGGAEAHVGRLRELYREKQDRARAALARELSGTGIAWNDPKGGFYFWVRLPRHVSARALLDVALQEGVAFVPGDAFAIEADHRSALRFSISAPTPARRDERVRP